MSNPVDEYTEIDDLLQRQNQLLNTLINLQGVSEAGQNVQDNPVTTPYEDIAIPKTGDLYGLPPGRTTFDFEKGRIRNQQQGTLDDDLRSFEDMTAAVENVSFDALRSLYIYADAPVKLEFSDRKGKFTLTQGSFYPLHSHAYRKFVLEADEPYAVQIDASTRSTAFSDSDSITGYLSRYGTDADTGNTGYTSVGLYPENLEATMANTASTAADVATEQLFIGGVTRIGAAVFNTGANNIDATIEVADNDKVLNDSSLWYEPQGAASTGIAPGDYTTFDMMERHRWMRIRYKASTSGDDVEAEATLHGGLD